MSLGARIKTRRKELGLSLRELAAKVGVTASYLSKVELEQTSPSIDSLRAISRALEVPVFLFLMEDGPASPVVRAAERLKLQRSHSRLMVELLTPDLNRRMEAFIFEQEPGSGNYAITPSQYTEEIIHVLNGQLEVELVTGTYQLNVGDTIYFEGPSLKSLKAIGTETMRVLAVVTPPVL